MFITEHAYERMKERNGLKKKSVRRIAERAYTSGLDIEDLNGQLQTWVRTKCACDKTYKVYGDKLYVFGPGTFSQGEGLITVLQIPGRYLSRYGRFLETRHG